MKDTRQHIDQPGQTYRPEDVSERRTAIEPELILEDEIDAAQPSPLGCSPFADAASLAGAAIRRQLAASHGRELAKATQGELAALAKDQMEAAARTNPILSGTTLAVSVRAVRKTPPGMFKEPARLVQSWLEIPKQSLPRTGKEIVASLNDRYQPFVVSKNFMSNELNKRQVKHIRGLLAKAGISASHRQCRTLSAVKQVVQDHFDHPEYETFEVKLSFARDGSHLLWNGKRHKIFDNSGSPSAKHGGKTYAVSTLRRVCQA